MNLDALFQMLLEAQRLSQHNDFVVIGSLSILGLEPDFHIPDAMALSNHVACYTPDAPGKIFEMVDALGENSAYHQKSGFYLDAVNPHLASLPEGWQQRLIKVRRDQLTLWFLEPNDAAISKYARGEPRDIRWIRAGIQSGVVSLPVVAARMRETNFLDKEEQDKAKALVEADRGWFTEPP